MDFGIDQVITTVLALFVMIMNKTPKFTAHGGSVTENLALQNIQARIRMVLSYFVASLILWVRGRKKLLLTLSTANSDEIVRGYLTKYDNSSGDLNPIGSYSKMELRNFIAFSCKYYQLSVLNLFLDSTPSAELVPTHTPFVQCDEVEMGMSYDDLFMYTRLRTLFRLGPYFLFKKLCNLWSHDYSPYDIAVKVKTFFHYYSINRHKSAVSTPIFHSGLNSSGDNCSDLRPILYNSDWTWQFLQIDKELNF
ncbi:Glutamine-dependent NAD(+) synthetase [Zancudomyces culisetae]|uniref:NAD(+) synthase (glutamine-hydrolyzing) n=1 Tax=Zancudomyces culisetae TaxID=1213189 RepID=A0A1R1PZ25_ZANCU|nr:Glutamine-dependent NAD(+) synthetase [Zancudomyces culisetae]|eukprot:OMH86191.1 Glutamine-dependent NAD(+) synthetase [Zancudomyces culisetae]